MTTVTEEYASALFALSAEEGVKRDVAESLKTVKSVFSEYPEYTELLAAPSLAFDERAELIDKAFSDNVHEFAVSFIKLLCERGHIRELTDCIDEYLKLYEASDGIATAYVTSAVDLTEEEKKALAEKLENKLSRKVELICDVDPAILGGIIVKADGNVMDGSLRHRLSDVKTVIGG